MSAKFLEISGHDCIHPEYLVTPRRIERFQTVKKTTDLRVELRRLTEEERAAKARLKKERGKLDETTGLQPRGEGAGAER